MNLLHEIFKWASTLPDWQKDAVRRLFENGTITESDLNDLTALAKASHGIADPANRTAKPLQQGQIPIPAATGDKVQLLGITNLENVNAIAPGQSMQVARKGVTAVYGDNGSGKSGYSRVLKRACRARDQEPVLPNVKLPEKDQGTPQAVFDIERNGTVSHERWIEGNDPPSILSSIAVFDARCARVYLDKEREAAFVPYGLDILTGLANVCTAVKERLSTEIASLIFRPEDFRDLQGNTAVGRAIAHLPGGVTTEKIKQLATLSEEEQARLAVLREAIKQPDPDAQVKVLGNLKVRLETAVGRAKILYMALSDEKVATARRLDVDWRTAKGAAELAAQSLTDDNTLLSGTGSEPWKKLFEAAREFSEGCAYPGHTFPFIESGARCPLCQQVLADGAERLRRFDDFIKASTERTEIEKRQARERAILEFKELAIHPIADNPTLDETRQIDPTVAQLLGQATPSLAARKAKILTAFDSGKWDSIEATPASPEPSSRVLVDTIQAHINALKEVTKGDRSKIEIELRELEARMQLAVRLPVVLETIEREKLRLAIVGCDRSINTYSISTKSTELTEMAVTEDLVGALNREFAALEATNLRVVLSSKTIKGVTRHKLRLDLSRDFDLNLILSEGEQRAIALASFLAEASVTPGNQSLVFDDPVSSLDHTRREIVARRLVAEAAQRQVIVFTHDLYFLNLLLHETEEQGIEPLAMTVFHGSEGLGMTMEDLPFEGKNIKARVGQLRALHQEAKKLWLAKDVAKYTPLIREGYRMLRDAWERAIEELLFNRSIMRFKKSIETKRIKKVSIEAVDQADVEKGMTKCSHFAHDRPLMAGMSIPVPDEFIADVEALESFRVRIQDRLEKE